MFESDLCRNLADVERKSNLSTQADLGSLEAATRVFSLLLISLLLASTTKNVFAATQAPLRNIVEAEDPAGDQSPVALAPGASTETIQAEAEEPAAASGDSVSESAGDQEWIRQSNFRDATGTDYVLVKADGLDRTALDAEMKLQMLAATNQYIDSQLESGASAYVNFDVDYIVRKIVVADKIYEESEDVSVGTGRMYTQYKQLRFDSSVRDQLAALWTEQKSKFRIMQMGLLGGSVMVVLSVAFLFFRINHATRGFYAGRLQFFAMAVILAVLISGIYAGRLLPWY